MKISDYPLIKTIILFLIGFLLAFYVKIDLYFSLSLIILFVLLSILFFKLQSKISSITISLALITIGYLLFSFSYYENEKEKKLLDKLEGKNILLYGYVLKVELLEKEKIQFQLDCDQIIVNNSSVQINQKVLVNLSLRDNTLSLNYFDKIISPGNYIRISGSLAKPAEANFIGDFDQRFYLKSKNINYILNSNIFEDLNLIKEDNSIFNFSRHLSALRQKLKSQIEQHFDFLNAAYIKGLFIAERSDIPEEIKEDFINSGVIHVLAVSGLHTGYIALILFAITGRFNKWLRLIFVAIGLFVFAHLANLSPSVVRASIMCVVVLLSLLIERNNPLLNSIALSALIILLINPLDIFNPGFQLSFSAVLSIALIYPVLIKITSASKLHGWKKYFVDMILISVAVSIGTFPFVITYYHKFSFIALLANLIVIPLTGIILGGIILNLVVINLFPFVSSIYKLGLVELINFNFDAVKFFGNLPIAYTSLKDFSIYNAFTFFLMLVIIILIINKNYKPLIKFVIVFILIFNYIFHYKSLSTEKINPNASYLFLIKMNNSNSIFIGDAKDNFFKFYEKSDNPSAVVNDFKKLDNIFWNINVERLKQASISSNAMWLNNNLRSRINNMNISRLENDIWYFGERSSSDLEEITNQDRSVKHRFLKNSFTEMVLFNDWIIIISPVEIEKIKRRLNKSFSKFIYIKPDLDTMSIKSTENDLAIVPLNLDKTGMKIFEIKTRDLKEINWR